MWSGAILVATSLPGALLRSAPIVPGADKAVHALLYGVLAYLVWRAVHLGPPTPRATLAPALRVLAGIAVFAAGDEWHQQFIPGRGAEAADWVADMAGATIGLTISQATPWRRGSAS